MNILPLLVLVACVTWQAYAQDEEARTLPRALLKRGPPVRAKPTTTTTTPPPQEEAEYEDEAEYPAEEAQEPSTEAPPSSTEGKKLVGNGVRPFRSNTDLLETLKRRRAQAAEAKLRAHANPDAPPAPEAPVEPAKSYNKKRYNSSAVKETVSEDAPASKPTRGRFGRPATRSVQNEEEQSDVAQPSSTTVRGGRGFSRRAN